MRPRPVLQVKLGRGKVPPGGWHYEKPPAIPRLEAGTEEALMKLLFEYKTRANLPIGDLEREIDDYYCEKYPSACFKEPSDYFPDKGQPAPPREPMLNRVTRWAAYMVTRMPRGGYELVSQAEADRRSPICGRCPKNVPWKNGCVGCSQTTSTLLMQLRKMRSSKQQGNLMACAVGGWDNITALWMPTDSLPLSEDQQKQLPKECWRK